MENSPSGIGNVAQTQPEKRGKGRSRGSGRGGRGGRRALTQQPEATQERDPDNVPGSPAPQEKSAPAARNGSINPPVPRLTRVPKTLSFLRVVKGATKTYESNVFDAVF